MGCDIHCWAEVRQPDGTWKKVGKIFKDSYYRPDEPSEVDEDGYEWNAQLTDHPYDGRNYALFSMLADVRNGVGFAGCDTGDGYLPIAFPKGIPIDVSPEVMKEFTVSVDEDNPPELLESWVRKKFSIRIDEKTVTDPDWHSASWLTVRELDAYNWNMKSRVRGWVDPAEFLKFKEKGKPEEWCGGIFGPKLVSNDEMARGIASGEIATSGNRLTTTHATQVEWQEPYKDSAGSFFTETMPALRALGNPDDVRIVFWFDN